VGERVKLGVGHQWPWWLTPLLGPLSQCFCWREDYTDRIWG
jgi:hypothetical protein